jgi:hypothetical protein
MPGWAKDLTTATQKVMDAQYMHGPGGLDNFYDQADSWITTQAFKRGSNQAYVPDPFQMTIPRRQVVGYDADGNMNSSYAPADPAIQMPALDPLPPVQTGGTPTGPFGPTGNVPLPTQTDQEIGAVMGKLVTIEQLLRTLLAK